MSGPHDNSRCAGCGAVGSELHASDCFWSSSKADWLQTFMGRAFYPGYPRQDDVDIEDIAHALSLICRFGGHSAFHYSVAQHSYLVSLAIERSGGSHDAVLWGLMHDSAEAYLGDLVLAVKRLPELGRSFERLERHVMLSICDKFGMAAVKPSIVKEYDLILLATEKRDVMNVNVHSGIAGVRDTIRLQERSKLPAWSVDSLKPLEERIERWSPERAEQMFLARFESLMRRQ